MKNEQFWGQAELLAGAYIQANDTIEKEIALGKVFEYMEGYVQSCIKNSVSHARNYDLEIPKEDFESRIMEYLWEALEAFNPEEGSTFKNIVIRRLKFAETHTWRQYKRKGGKNDKDGVTYESARWVSLNASKGNSEEGEAEDLLTYDLVSEEAKSAEDEFLEQNEEMDIVDQFGQEVNERYANVIRYMAKGYEGDELAIKTGEAQSNDAKMRKLVSRSKKAFKTFMEELSR